MTEPHTCLTKLFGQLCSITKYVCALDGELAHMRIIDLYLLPVNLLRFPQCSLQWLALALFSPMSFLVPWVCLCLHFLQASPLLS